MTTPAATPPVPESPRERLAGDPAVLAQRHLRFGWWTLLLFLTLGLVLEALHGFKVGAYLNPSNDTRRLVWTLAHAHGTLFGLLNLAFAFTVGSLPGWPARPRAIASACLRGATLLMPAGFFLGGVRVYAGDPGVGIVLVPVGGLLLLAAVLLTALSVKLAKPAARPGERGNATPRRK
ncbi:MAG TPA: hypothetical protein VFT34_07955 [Verrucomicrobiae bacterium]|nr:hypothetical protein [Verrucomicrobiae bacterium]